MDYIDKILSLGIDVWHVRAKDDNPNAPRDGVYALTLDDMAHLNLIVQTDDSGTHADLSIHVHRPGARQTARECVTESLGLGLAMVPGSRLVAGPPVDALTPEDALNKAMAMVRHAQSRGINVPDAVRERLFSDAPQASTGDQPTSGGPTGFYL